MTEKSECDPIAEWMEVLHSGQDSIREEGSHLAAAGIETEPLPSPVRVHPATYTHVSIFLIDRDFAALHADDFPANTPHVHASDTHYA